MFRIWIYLNLSSFLSTLFFFNNNSRKNSHNIKRIISKQSNKKYTALFSQCRVAFFFILKFLKSKKSKSEIIFCAYNLPEMINIAENLNLKVRFCDLDYATGFINFKDLKKNISKKTIAIVLTNMFNNYKASKEIKKIAKKNKIPLIEDNAIYFDNYSKINKELKVYSGNLGDYTIFSFNIMKNISSFFGGAASTNNKNFIEFYKKNEINLNDFFYFPLIKQIIIYLILKLMSIKFLYKTVFTHVIKYVYKKNIKSILQIFYPSLKLIKKKFPKYYFSKISNLAINNTIIQLKNKKRRSKIFVDRKKKHKYYFKKLMKIKNNNFNLINVTDENYQNFLDFPILVKDKNKLNEYLLDKGIEVRLKHYYNCEKFFGNGKKCINAQKYEKELICLPIHPNITLAYIDLVVKNIDVYYSR